MGNYGIFLCCNQQYLPFLHVLFNSLEKHKINIPVELLYYNFPEDYIKYAQDKFSFPIIPTEIKREDFQIHKFNEKNNNLFIKQSRFKYIYDKGVKYDAICMLDTDMFVCTHNIMNLFDLVKDTNKLIACNERFKWNFGSRYHFNNEPIFEKGVKALKFHCSVPLFFDLKRWILEFNYYNKIAINTFEVDDKQNIVKPVGDIYCWNISVYKNNRQDDVILFPMQTMTQVHYTYAQPWTELRKEGDNWVTFDGDEVFFIHGRIGNPAWAEGQLRGVKKRIEDRGMPFNENRVTGVLNKFKKEWYTLAYKSAVSLEPFITCDKYKHLL